MKQRKKIYVSWPRGHSHPAGVRMPGTGYPFWRRLVIAPSETVRCIALAHAVLCYRCHYMSGTYVPCLWDVNGDCPYHGDDSQPRLVYQGSLPVVLPTGGPIHLLNLTSAALHRGRPPVEDRQDLLGRWLTVARRAGGRNAQMSCAVGELAGGQWEGKAILPAEIWRVQTNVWGVELLPTDFAAGRPQPETQGPVQPPPFSDD